MKKFKPIALILAAGFIATSLAGCMSGLQNSQTDLATVKSETENTSISDIVDITIHTINIEIAEDDWASMLANPMDEEFFPANVEYDGLSIKNVAFRTKGNSSLQSVAKSDSERYGFKIKLDKYIDGQTLNGTNEFVLNACFSDPSYMREYITYKASEYVGLLTPECEYSALYINGELYGLYLYVEAFDDTFVEKYSQSTDTNLYKADSESCTLLKDRSTEGFELKYGNDEELSNINTLIDALDSATPENSEELKDILDIESVLKWTALSYVTGNYDSYLGDKAHNYYLLYSDGKFKMIGWDYNMAFGAFPSDGGSSLKADAEDPFIGTTSQERPLIAKLLEIDEYKDQYLEYVQDLKSWFTDYESAIEKLSEELLPYVENDPTAFYTVEEFKENIANSAMSLDDVKDISNPSQAAGDNIPPAAMPQGEQPDRSQIPEGERPDRNQMPEVGVKEMRNNSEGNRSIISIVDYIRLRLANI